MAQLCDYTKPVGVDKSFLVCQQGEIQWCDEHMAQLCDYTKPIGVDRSCLVCQQGEIQWCNEHMTQLCDYTKPIGVDKSFLVCQQGEIQWCNEHMAQLSDYTKPIGVDRSCLVCQQGEIQWCNEHMTQLCDYTKPIGVDLCLVLCVNRVRSSGVTSTWPSSVATQDLSSCADFIYATSSPPSSARTLPRDSPRSVCFLLCRKRWGHAASPVRRLVYPLYEKAVYLIVTVRSESSELTCYPYPWCNLWYVMDHLCKHWATGNLPYPWCDLWSVMGALGNWKPPLSMMWFVIRHGSIGQLETSLIHDVICDLSWITFVNIGQLETSQKIGTANNSAIWQKNQCKDLCVCVCVKTSSAFYFSVHSICIQCRCLQGVSRCQMHKRVTCHPLTACLKAFPMRGLGIIYR